MTVIKPIREDISYLQCILTLTMRVSNSEVCFKLDTSFASSVFLSNSFPCVLLLLKMFVSKPIMPPVLSSGSWAAWLLLFASSSADNTLEWSSAICKNTNKTVVNTIDVLTEMLFRKWRQQSILAFFYYTVFPLQNNKRLLNAVSQLWFIQVRSQRGMKVFSCLKNNGPISVHTYIIVIYHVIERIFLLNKRGRG